MLILPRIGGDFKQVLCFARHVCVIVTQRPQGSVISNMYAFWAKRLVPFYEILSAGTHAANTWQRSRKLAESPWNNNVGNRCVVFRNDRQAGTPVTRLLIGGFSSTCRRRRTNDDEFSITKDKTSTKHVG